MNKNVKLLILLCIICISFPIYLGIRKMVTKADFASSRSDSIVNAFRNVDDNLLKSNDSLIKSYKRGDTSLTFPTINR